MLRRSAIAIVCGATVALAGCGGGGASSVPSPVAPTSQPAKKPDAYVVLHVPPKHITTKYVSPAVQGVDFTVNGSAGQYGYVFYPISASESYCTTPSGGGLTCTLAIVAPAGNDTITVNTYDEPAPTQSANGVYANILSTGTITTTISPNAQNTINVVTNGTPSYVLQHVDNMYPALGTPFSEPVRLEVLDADGYYILGTYSQPITLTVSDPSVTVSPATVSDSTTAATVTLSYNGAASVPALVEIDSTYGGSTYAFTDLEIGKSGLNFAPSALIFAHANSATQQAVLTGVGATPTPPYTLHSWEAVGTSGSSGYSDPVCSDATFSMGSNASGAPVLNVTPVSAGSCIIEVDDANGKAAAIDFVVSP